MQSIFLPEHVIKELERLIRSFIWGDGTDGRKLHTMSLETICLPKSQGGLGVRDLRNNEHCFPS